MADPRWTVTALTVPGREAYLDRLAESLRAVAGRTPMELVVVHNARVPIDLRALERRLRGRSGLRCRAYANASEPTIALGRRLQLAVARTPLIAFVDDDCTLHGDIFPAVEAALERVPVGAVGLPSVDAESGAPFKPRDTTPSVMHEGLRFMPIQGMFVATYRRLLVDAGDFATHRRYWGEWTELNTRLWRLGCATAYVPDAGFLRHWTKAPSSPTRTLSGRERHIVWGLLCTALEYDATGEVPDAAFWALVASRYLPYAYGREPTATELLQTIAALAPQLAAEWGAISAHAERARAHPFPFRPFHQWSEADVRAVLADAPSRLGQYRAEAFGAAPAPDAARWRWWRRRAPDAPATGTPSVPGAPTVI
jgi:hypothetical protein